MYFLRRFSTVYCVSRRCRGQVAKSEHDHAPIRYTDPQHDGNGFRRVALGNIRPREIYILTENMKEQRIFYFDGVYFVSVARGRKIGMRAVNLAS